ncbi:uncharacterized protein LOC114359585 isoform X1 [Ostrinia furnacalis]|uniref:uncharacterized protein LOC114359585 isoform X1 n=1 Tax=Ostrinia furnacalis TaxID=93504 RepID=UPI00103AA165|nr:uncharacterized protein LOC114359585 isoform X1 [Ostrinia furnacalis]XP_028169832.1 uncharacterized protein LOC114359585 isoform X1 [Ostrinia furnacalis]
MDGDRKIHISEGVPLNSTGAANIFLNTGKSTAKLNSPDGTVIHLKTEKPADLGVHINTTFSVASSKKIRLLFILNFLFSIICMILSCSVALYYWNEMISMRKQLDLIRDQFLLQSLGPDKGQASPLVYQRPLQASDVRHPRMDSSKDEDILPNPKKYFVENLGEDMLLVDSTRKIPRRENLPVHDLSLASKEPLVVHFNGAVREVNMGTQSFVGPWVRDMEISSRNSETKIELNDNSNYVTIKEEGLYLVYAQVVYLTQSPNCYFLWARQNGQAPRLLTTCASGDDSSRRPLDKSQISCAVQTVARLYKGDIVNVAQREQNKTLWLRPGYSYFGFIKLSS